MNTSCLVNKVELLALLIGCFFATKASFASDVDTEIAGFLSAYLAQQNSLIRGDVLICAEENYDESTKDVEGVSKERFVLARFLFDKESDRYKCFYRAKTSVATPQDGNSPRITVSDDSMGATVESGKIVLTTPGRKFGSFEFTGLESFEKNFGMNYIAIGNIGFCPFGQYSSQCGIKNAAMFQSSEFKKTFAKKSKDRLTVQLSRSIDDSINGITRSDVIWEWNEQLLVPIKVASVSHFDVDGESASHLNYEETFEWGTFEGLPVIHHYHRQSFDAALRNGQVIKPMKTVDVSFHWLSVNQDIPKEDFSAGSLRDVKALEDAIDRKRMKLEDVLTLEPSKN